MRASFLSTDVTISAPLLHLLSSLDPIESLSYAAKCLGNSQVTKCFAIVHLLQDFQSQGLGEYELQDSCIARQGLPYAISDTILQLEALPLSTIDFCGRLCGAITSQNGFSLPSSIHLMTSLILLSFSYTALISSGARLHGPATWGEVAKTSEVYGTGGLATPTDHNACKHLASRIFGKEHLHSDVLCLADVTLLSCIVGGIQSNVQPVLQVAGNSRASKELHDLF